MHARTLERGLVFAWLAFDVAKGAQVALSAQLGWTNALVLAAMVVMLVNTLRREPVLAMRFDFWALCACAVSLFAMMGA
jgi:hypothetical protein